MTAITEPVLRLPAYVALFFGPARLLSCSVRITHLLARAGMVLHRYQRLQSAGATAAATTRYY